MKRGLFNVLLALAIFLLAVAFLRFAVQRAASKTPRPQSVETPPTQSQDIDLGEINHNE
jgi:hypothetical protein